MQRDSPMPGRGEQSITQIVLPVLLQERGGKPSRLVAVQDLSGLVQIASPENVGLGGTRAIIGEHHAWDCTSPVAFMIPTVRPSYSRSGRIARWLAAPASNGNL